MQYNRVAYKSKFIDPSSAIKGLFHRGNISNFSENSCA